jgi:hypothetical protein
MLRFQWRELGWTLVVAWAAPRKGKSNNIIPSDRFFNCALRIDISPKLL